MPTMATSAGAGTADVLVASDVDRRPRLDQLGAAVGDVVVQLGERRDLVAQRRDLADHVHPARPTARSASTSRSLGTAGSRSWSRRRGRRPWRRPAAGRGSAPRARPAPPRAASPRARSRRSRPRTASTNGDGTQRVAWPGPLSSSTVRCSRPPPAGTSAVIAPGSTASSVNRYAVPISTPTRTPRSAARRGQRRDHRRGPASWMPPANRTWQSRGSRRGISSSRRATIVSHSTKLRARPDVTAALATLEDEPPGAVLEEQPSSPGDGTCR